MKFLSILFLSILLIGCKPGPRWIERHEPTTDSERRAVADHVEAIMRATPQRLSGHDQDWDDAIAEAHRQARLSLCRQTFWEFEGDGFFSLGRGYTGRWRYAEGPIP